MNLEEARKVLWLKSNHRPIGELLDEGYLNQLRLEWAAEKAYDPHLKQAAKIILESEKTPSPAIKTEEEKPKISKVQTPINSLEIDITLDKARATQWPFAPYKGQSMGSLVESKQLSLKDLGYAIENTWDEKVRRAAIALSLVRLEQVVKEPVSDAGFIHVVSGGRSYSEREEIRLTLIQGIMFGFLLVVMIILSILAIAPAFRSHPSGPSLSEVISTPLGALTLVIVLVLCQA